MQGVRSKWQLGVCVCSAWAELSWGSSVCVARTCRVAASVGRVSNGPPTGPPPPDGRSWGIVSYVLVGAGCGMPGRGGSPIALPPGLVRGGGASYQGLHGILLGQGGPRLVRVCI